MGNSINVCRYHYFLTVQADLGALVLEMFSSISISNYPPLHIAYMVTFNTLRFSDQKHRQDVFDRKTVRHL